MPNTICLKKGIRTQGLSKGTLASYHQVTRPK